MGIIAQHSNQSCSRVVDLSIPSGNIFLEWQWMVRLMQSAIYVVTNKHPVQREWQVTIPCVLICTINQQTVILQHPPISPRRGPYHPQKKQIVPTQSDISSYITTTSGTAKSILRLQRCSLHATSHSLWQNIPSFSKIWQKVQDSIKIAKDRFKYVVTCIVNDNARNMDKMKEGAKEDDFSQVVYGCWAHLLNLLGQDITPSSVTKHVMEIQKYFRNHHKPNVWLTDCPDTVKPQLPT